MATENIGIYFTELTLQNVRCFGDKATLKLSNEKGEWTRWNVILGDNGTGKTTLLQCLAGMETISSPFDDLTGKVSKLYINNENYSFSRLQRTENYLEVDVEARLTTYDNHSHDTIGFGQTKQFRHISKLTPIIKEDFFDAFVLGYGANRSMSFNKLSESKSENSQTLFDEDAKLINAEEWLLQMDYAASKDSKIKDLAINRRNQIIEILKDVLPDVEDIRFSIPDKDNIIPKTEFLTSYGWVGVQNLSFGYKTMVAWIVDVAARMFDKYSNMDNPLNGPVIILVDEIDLHLHPKWQRQIFDFLETRFPKAQFIVTAHSPLIAQSAPKDANIIVLKKEKVGEEYVVKIDNDIESVRNWRIDQIMASDLFGLESSRNPSIEKQLAERTVLLKKNNLSKEEKQRLAVLNKIAHNLPTAESKEDIEAMDIIRKAADYLKNQQK